MDSVKILAIDDVPMNLEMLEVMLLSMPCRFLKAGNGRDALDLLQLHPDTDTILLDLTMPVMDGFEMLAQLKMDRRLRDIPVIVITSDKDKVLRSLSLGANDFIATPYDPQELKLRVMNQLRSKKLLDHSNDMGRMFEQEVVKKTSQLQKALDLSLKTELEISHRLGMAAEYRDPETGMHIKRLSVFSKALGKLAGLSEKACEILRYAAPLHDVGKIGIPDSILLKPGKLEPGEYEIMKTHTVIGGKILSDAQQYPVIAAGRIIALQHHEKWDGSGYPYGLSGRDIHIFGRIVMIVDVFDALLSERPYKKAFSLELTLAVMQDGVGSFFDPGLFRLFLDNLQDFLPRREELERMSDAA